MNFDVYVSDDLWTGEPTAIPFESFRGELGAAPEDPFEPEARGTRRPTARRPRRRVPLATLSRKVW